MILNDINVINLNVSVSVMYEYFIKALNMHDYLLYTIASSFFFFMTFGSAFSVQIRCIVTCMLPAFFCKVTRNMLVCLAILYLTMGPIKNLSLNLKEASRSISCGKGFTLNTTQAEAELSFRPIKQALENLQVCMYTVYCREFTVMN